MKKKTPLGPPRNKPLPDLFPKIPAKVPARVQDAAALWLDLFMHLSELTASERTENLNQPNTSARHLWLETSAELSDFALELYEERWPHSGRKGD